MRFTWSKVVSVAAVCLKLHAADPVAVSSVRELAEAAGRSGQIIKMVPGVYRLTDHIPLSSIPERRNQKQWPFITFSGSNNIFHLQGVTVELDTELRSALRPPVHSSDFVVSGEGNLFFGLTITNIGNGTSPGGAAISITGSSNTLRDCTLYVCGSFPYGYGDLFGKGGPDIIRHQKKSGVHVTGNGTTLLGCKLFMRSFGHGYYIQQDAGHVRLENCYVEGLMRPTDEMLLETNSPASKVNFRTVAKTRDGKDRVMPGYMKSLSEDGFRTYGQHKNLSFINCVAKNMRGAFELRSRTAVRLENCSAIGCERGFWVSTGAVLRNCRGDAQFGPLLFIEGDNASVELDLLPTESSMTVHALATIHGTGHNVTLKSTQGTRKQPLPILVGYGTPMMGEGMAPIPEKPAKRVNLRNETNMRVVRGEHTTYSDIMTHDRISEN